jgi:hypothetical protein
MRNLTLMALDIANRLTDQQLAEEIEILATGKLKLRLKDERGRPFPLHPIILAVYRQVQDERKKVTPV